MNKVMNYADFTYERLIATLLGERGYVVYMDDLDSTENYLFSPAMAILTPVSITDKSGGVRGRVTSQLTFLLSKNASHMSPEDASQLWRDLRCDAIGVACELQKVSSVVALSGLKLSSYERGNRKTNEVSVKVSVTIISNFDSSADSTELV